MSYGGDRRATGHFTNDLKISEGPKQPHRSRDIKIPVKADDRRWRTKRDAKERSGGGILRPRTGADEGQGSDCLVLGFQHRSTGGVKHYGHASNSRRDQLLRKTMPVEQGRVKSLKDKGFGFLECCDRAGDMFFHQTESSESLCVGDEVEFRVEGANVNNRKPRAVKLCLLPAGSISFEQQVEGLWEGVVKREPCQPSKGHRSGGRGHGGWGEESAIGWIGDVKAVLPLEPSAGQIQKPHQSTAPVSDAMEFSRDGGLSPVSVPVAGEHVVIPTDGVESSHLYQKYENGVPETTRSQIVHMGDVVHFSVSRHKPTNTLYARRIHVVRSAREVKLDCLKEEGNLTKEKGVVMKLLPEYGFLRSTTRSQDVYFSIKEVLKDNDTCDVVNIKSDWRRGKGRDEERNCSSNVQSSSPVDHTVAVNGGGGVENGNDNDVSCGGSNVGHPRLREGAEAEFYVIMEDTNPQALEIQLLPPGSVTLREIIHKGVMGVVQRSPIRQKGKRKPGSAIFHHTQARPLHDSSVCGGVNSNNDVDGEKWKEVDNIHASLAGGIEVSNWGTTADSTVKFLPGDCIISDLMIDHKDKRFSAVNVQVISMAGPRLDGIVWSIKKDEGIGFISSSHTGEEVYFRLSDVLGGNEVARSLSIISEVRFNVLENKGGYQDRPRAVRLEVLPPYTVLSLEGKDVSGTVTYEARVPDGSPTMGAILINEDCKEQHSTGTKEEVVDKDAELPDYIRTQIDAIEEASPGISIPLPAGLTAAQRAAVIRTVTEKSNLGYNYTKEGGKGCEEQLCLWKLSHQAAAHRRPVTRQLLEVSEFTAKEEAKQLTSLRASEHGLSAKDGEAAGRCCMLVDFRASYVLGKDWACKGDDILFDLVYNCLSERYWAIRIRIKKRVAQTTKHRGYIESLSTEKSRIGYIILPDTLQRVGYTMENVTKQQQQSVTQMIKEEEVVVKQYGGGATTGGGQVITSATSENAAASMVEIEANTARMMKQEDKDLKEQQQHHLNTTASLSVHAPVWDPPLSVDDIIVCELVQDETERMIAINVRRPVGKGSIPRVPLNKLPEKREQGNVKSETLRQYGVIVVPPRKYLMEDSLSGEKGGGQIQTEASVALVRTEKGNKILCLSPVRLLSFTLEEMKEGEGLEDLARGDLVSFLLSRGKDGRQMLTKVRISRRRLIPRIRGTVDCLKPEGNPTHASILALGSIAPSTVLVPLVNVVGVVHLKEGDKVEFLACAAATLSSKQLGDNVMSSGFGRPATEVVTSSTSQRIGAEASASAAVTLNDLCLSGSKGISSALAISLPSHRNHKTYMGLMLVKDLEDTGVQKREGSRKSRHAATAIRMILAKGPDGTKGFLPGWCSRYPVVAAVVQGEEGSKQDDDVRNDNGIPVGVSQEESVVVSKNNTEDCFCSSSNSQGEGGDTTAISTTTTVSMST